MMHIYIIYILKSSIVHRIFKLLISHVNINEIQISIKKIILKFLTKTFEIKKFSNFFFKCNVLEFFFSDIIKKYYSSK